jgi:hypothetical protein
MNALHQIKRQNTVYGKYSVGNQFPGQYCWYFEHSIPHICMTSDAL